MEETNQNIFRRQFACHNFSLTEVPTSLFYRTQWSPNRIIYFMFRSFMLAQSLAWIIVYWATANEINYEKLTNLVELVSFVYYILAFVLAFCGATCERNKDDSTGFLKILQGLTWWFQTTVFHGTFWVTVLYWALLASTENHVTALAIAVNANKHALVLVFSVIDIFVVANPVRLYHSIYPIAFYIVYAFVLLGLHWSGVDSAVYSFTDFAKNPPTMAWILIVVITFISPFPAHFLFFCLFALRDFIYNQSFSTQVKPLRERIEVTTIIANKNVVINNDTAENLEMQTNIFA